jgi:hypothetical protein
MMLGYAVVVPPPSTTLSEEAQRFNDMGIWGMPVLIAVGALLKRGMGRRMGYARGSLIVLAHH